MCDQPEIFSEKDRITEEICDKIVKAPKGENYMCSFMAIYNSLRDPQKRLAWSAGNTVNISQAFKDLIFKNGNELSKPNGGGYNHIDIGFYLDWLKKQGHIKAYRWVNFKKFSLFRLLNPNNTRTVSILLFGVSVASDKRPGKRLKVDNRSGNTKLVLECNLFEAFNIAYNGPRCTHGVVVSREESGDIYLYDDGCIKRKLISQDVAGFSDRISGIWRGGARVFDITV